MNREQIEILPASFRLIEDVPAADGVHLVTGWSVNSGERCIDIELSNAQTGHARSVRFAADRLVKITPVVEPLNTQHEWIERHGKILRAHESRLDLVVSDQMRMSRRIDSVAAGQDAAGARFDAIDRNVAEMATPLIERLDWVEGRLDAHIQASPSIDDIDDTVLVPVAPVITITLSPELVPAQVDGIVANLRRYFFNGGDDAGTVQVSR